MTDDILLWMMEERHVKSGYNAAAIMNGLELWSADTVEEKKARVLLYRRWRPDSKSKITAKQAFQLTLNGLDPADFPDRQMELFEQPIAAEAAPQREL